jgi:endoglycosylceramidase
MGTGGRVRGRSAVAVALAATMLAGAAARGPPGGRATNGNPLPARHGPAVEAPDPRFVVDHRGRVLILRGQNVISAAKSDPLHVGGVDEDEIAQLSHRYGFNVSRHLIFWEAVEPEPGVYDEAYLDRVGQRLDWYAEHGIYVFLDMHQDLYSQVFGGDGAPAWAVHTDGLTFQGIPPGAPWWLAAADPAVQAAFANFWDPSRGHPELQEHYRKMWAHVAKRFHDHPAVLGYDLMNEPTWSLGGLTETITFARTAHETGDWRNPRLITFTQQLIDEIRTVDPDGYLLYEPTSVVNADVDLGGGLTGPFPGDLAPLTDPRPGPSRLVYAPHLYPVEVHEGVTYSPGNPYVDRWEQLRSTEATRFGGGALFIGEFGANLDDDEADARYFRDVLDLADRQMAGWAYWSWDKGWWGIRAGDGSDATHADFVVRPYPQVIAGVPQSFSFDTDNRVFRLSYRTRAGVEGPTEIYLATGRHYPEGVNVTISRGTAATKIDVEHEVLLVHAAPGTTDVEVCVTPAGTSCPPA